MSKFKYFVYAITILIALATGNTVSAGENTNLTFTDSSVTYKFDNEETLQAFKENRYAGRSIDLYYPLKTTLASSYTKVKTSNRLITTVNGGRYGGTMSIGANRTVSIGGEGVTVSVTNTQGASFNVPKGKFGNIVLKSRIQYKRYKMERKIGNKTINLGGYTIAYPISSWYEAVYW